MLTKGLEASEGKVKELEVAICRVELENGETLSVIPQEVDSLCTTLVEEKESCLVQLETNKINRVD